MVQHQGSWCLNLPRVFSSFKRVLNEKDLACWNGNKPHCFLRGKAPMEDAALIESSEGVFEGNKECESGRSHKTFGDLMKEKGRDSSSSSEITEELDGQSQVSAEDSYSSASMGWQVQEISASNCTTPLASEYAERKDLGKENSQDQDSVLSVPVQELDMITNRLSKLLLGEDMSGSGNGVPTAMVISNAITNLCATMFGQLWKLEPLPAEKKTMWRREMELLLCVSDHIVELKPTWQTFPDGTKIEVMTSRPRSDLYVNLPALRKLDSMLLEILDSFVNPEFRYVDQGVLPTDRVGSSFRQALQRLEEKWWLPVPQVPPCGLSEDARKQLQHRRDCTNQILKAAMAINANALAEMDIPQSYLEYLPKTARANLGDVIYRYITSDDFSPAYLLACLDLSSEYQAMEIANRVEASICIWNKKTSSKPVQGRTTRSSSRSSWEVIMDRIVEGDKIETFAERAETLLLSLKQRFPGLPQTALDTSKIQYNKDVGKSILESYSRVLESLASNILARIDDVLYVDDLNKHSDEFSSLSNIGVIAHKSISVPFSMPGQHSPYRSSFGTPNFSPEHGVSPANGANSPFMNTSNNLPQRGAGVNRVLTDVGSSIDRKKKGHRLSPMEKFVPTLKTFDEVPPVLETDLESSDTEEDVSSWC